MTAPEKLEAYRVLLMNRPSADDADAGYDSWFERVVRDAEDPAVAAGLPALVQELGARDRKNLLELNVEPLLLAALGCLEGAQLQDALNRLLRSPDSKGRILDGIARHPAAAKHALENWPSTNDRLLLLAEAVRDDETCNTIAARAIEFVQAFAEEGESMVPPFSGYLGVERIGGSWRDRDEALRIAEQAGREAQWQERVEWPRASFEFAVPKSGKTTLTFEVEPTGEVPQPKWGTKTLHVVPFGRDDEGWLYSWDAGSGSFLRTRADKLQWLIYFFGWLGNEVAAP